MSVATRARLNHNAILVNDLNACSDIDEILTYPGNLQDTWVMPFNTKPQDLFYRLWFVEAFASPEVYRCAQRVCREVDNFWSDLARLHHKTTGEPMHVNQRAVVVQKHRMLTAMWPTWKTVVDEASSVKAWKARKNLDRLCIRGGEWLAR